MVTVEHNRQTVEITIRQSGLIFRAEATDFEMNDALDQVISALGRQIRKNKTKLEKKLHSGALRDYVEDYYNGEAVSYTHLLWTRQGQPKLQKKCNIPRFWL